MKRIVLLLVAITLLCTLAFAEKGVTISFDAESYSVAIGKTLTLSPVVSPKSKIDLDWSSSDETVATVAKNGTLHRSC